ncbi:hypothetical protein ASPFODRAFT_460992 [Aspergillus luchuensis CBS 106.47]|uniref:Uncharacterized protein n=1 Tax=Aspergillus luchuensis (strain CBS 106.47) TaxID=1137211 RepID=A0A1M3T0V7_ASPLC|nr:hypothetical protein ASPFODRAFT_460992 [Aspergillus luchuensis CBS 106.47]
MPHSEPRWQKTFVVYIAYGVHPKCGGYFPIFVILESEPVVLPFKIILILPSTRIARDRYGCGSSPVEQ